LLGMRERAELAGGTFIMQSAPARGTEIHLCFPLRSVVLENPESLALAPHMTA